MTNAITKITTHFRNKIGGEMKSIVVPEWELTIYYKPSITLREQGKIIEAATKGNQLEALVEALIIKARNEDGSKMFLTADKMTFMNEADPDILIRVVAGMNAENEAEETFNLDEVAKN
jgi:hypothetical protein